MGGASRIVEATRGRDRVLDAAKAFALLAVICGHSLAWHVEGGRAINVLEVRPDMWWITWGFQVLPLFFAAGAVSNFGALSRVRSADYLRSRHLRLVTPVLVYAAVWAVLLLPAAALTAGDQHSLVVGLGRFLSQLLWFAAVYLVVVATAPITAAWPALPALGTWLALIVLVDGIRIAAGDSGWASIGWLNLLLVWGWLHQVGRYLPRLRESLPQQALIAAGLLCAAAALAIAWLGPYSRSLITVAGDPEISNLAPPTVVVAVFGLGQILLLAGLWRWLERVLSRDRVWVPVALVGSRGMGLYLWHIPVVACCAGVALALGWQPDPLTASWWAGHVAAAVVAVAGAWLLAGAASAVEGRLRARDAQPGSAQPGSAQPGSHSPLRAILSGLVILHLSVVGFATWWGAGALGVPGSAPLLIVLLWLLRRSG